MKEKFCDKKFRETTLQLIETCAGILDEYQSEGYKLTLRQLYYRIVALDLFPDDRRWRWDHDRRKWYRDLNGTKNALPNYKWLGGIVSDARMAGLFDWDMIVDRGRETIENSHWRHPGEILKDAKASFGIDKWREQPCHVEVMCEKQALEGILEPVCLELDVPFCSNKGYSSQSFMYRKGKELRIHADNEKSIHVLYFGDHDPSGLDMDRDVEERIGLFCNYEAFGGYYELKRIALTMPQIDLYDPPENPAKQTDSRFAEYQKRHGDSSWELDALEPKVLARLVRNSVEDLRNEQLWQQACEDEENMRCELEEIFKGYNPAKWFKLWKKRLELER